ncbi:hypothetical protein ACFZB9_10720 [Kitasatospora sp. NPDC008050]|uniref:hypothetical protein n=1 Tax=Kitasatospora sp. NPDC008050 TaxID=3364021 RepID=UPI0036E23144
MITGPFRPFPRSALTGQWSLSPVPPWFVHNRSAHDTGRLLLAFAARPSLRALSAVLASALRG